MTSDPTQVHSAACDECDGTVRDGEQSLFPWGLKSVCADCICDLEAEGDYESAEDETPLSDRWLFIAGDISGAL